MKIFFDMDGTINNFYNMFGWLEAIQTEQTTPYDTCECTLTSAEKALIKILRNTRTDVRVGIISWTAKNSTLKYEKAVTESKRAWVNKYLDGLFDEIFIVPYGTPKNLFCLSPKDILFDDEEQNRTNWTGKSYKPEQILEILRQLL